MFTFDCWSILYILTIHSLICKSFVDTSIAPNQQQGQVGVSYHEGPVHSRPSAPQLMLPQVDSTLPEILIHPRCGSRDAQGPCSPSIYSSLPSVWKWIGTRHPAALVLLTCTPTRSCEGSDNLRHPRFSAAAPIRRVPAPSSLSTRSFRLEQVYQAR